jgi:hypothetical protein
MRLRDRMCEIISAAESAPVGSVSPVPIEKGKRGPLPTDETSMNEKKANSKQTHRRFIMVLARPPSIQGILVKSRTDLSRDARALRQELSNCERLENFRKGIRLHLCSAPHDDLFVLGV